MWGINASSEDGLEVLMTPTGPYENEWWTQDVRRVPRYGSTFYRTTLNGPVAENRPWGRVRAA